MKDTLRRNAVQKAKTLAPAKAPTPTKALSLSQAQVAGKQVAEQIIAQVTIAAQEKVKALLAQVKAGTAALKQSTLDTKMMALLTGSLKSSSVDNRMVELAAAEAKRMSR
jgi:hypothetical protein